MMKKKYYDSAFLVDKKKDYYRNGDIYNYYSFNNYDACLKFNELKNIQLNKGRGDYEGLRRISW